MKYICSIVLFVIILVLSACGTGNISTSDSQQPTTESAVNATTESAVNATTESVINDQNPIYYSYSMIAQLHRDRATIERCKNTLNIAPKVTASGNAYYILQTDTFPVLILFDSDQTISSLCALDFSNGIDERRIEQIKVGGLFDDVYNIDPNGFYPFLHAGYSETPMCSLHYVGDKGLYIFEYDENNKVSTVRFLENTGF